MTDKSADLVIYQRANTINGMASEIGEWAKGKGFREDWEMADKLELIAAEVLDDGERGLDQHDTLKRAAELLRNNVIGTKLMLVVSEAAEALETLRDHGAAGLIAGEGNFGEELADIEIRVKDLANMTRSNLGGEEVAKIEKNIGRPHKHGREL